MKKDCETCLKHDRNHHAADCLYCMQANRQSPKVIKYIIIGYTSDIDIKSNTAKIRYLHCDHTGFYKYDLFWVDELELTTTFDYREDAQEIIDQYDYLKNCITYGIEE